MLLLPGNVYGDAGNHFRVGFGRRNISSAVQRLEDFMATWRGSWDGIPRAETWLEAYCKVVPELDDQRKVVQAVAKRW